MRTIIYGSVITVVLAFVGMAQAANDLDGKALLCQDEHKSRKDNPYYGFVFDDGKVKKWEARGYSKVFSDPNAYRVIGQTKVIWRGHALNRQTLSVNGSQCKISSKKEIFLKLDEIITNATKKKRRFFMSK